MPNLHRWLAILLLLLAALLPAGGSGLVLCMDTGPDAHLAIEWASCCDDPVPAAGPVATDSPECGDCRDIPLPSMASRMPARPCGPELAVAPPPPAPCILAATPAGDVEVSSFRCTAPAPRVIPLPLRI